MGASKAGGGVLADILMRSHRLAPNDLPALIAEETSAGLGARECAIYLIDYAQTVLVPLAPPARERPSLEIDGTLAGRAFATTELHERQEECGVRLWLPILDGVERIGVLELLLDDVDDERRDLARAVAGLTAQLLETKDPYTDVYAQTRRRLGMSLAAEIQWDLLPPLTFGTDRVTVSGTLEPAYDIGGDTFDYALNGDVLHLAIIDAMGHGLPASMTSGLAVGAYRHARRHGELLDEVYARISAMLEAEFGGDRFATAQLAELDCAGGRLRWLNAGHPGPLLVRNGKAVGPVECEPSLPVGMGGAVRQIAEVQLEPGDLLMFFTDGVVEARSPVGDFFGEQRLAELLTREVASGMPAPEVLRRLTRAVLAHQGGELQDDATMLFVQWHGRSGSADAGADEAR